MITVSNVNYRVKASIKLSIGWTIPFEFERRCEMDAVLLANEINKDLKDKIKAIRRAAYEAGWKDAKSKKVPKKDWFNGNINSDFIG